MTSFKTSRSPVLLQLLPWALLLLISLPAIELVATIWLSRLIGWWVLVWYVASAIVGILILKSWRLSLALALVGSLQRGEVPLGRLFWVVRSLFAALLFIFPGPVSDLLGILLIMPWPGHRITLGSAAVDEVIEGEFARVDEIAPPQNGSKYD